MPETTANVVTRYLTKAAEITSNPELTVDFHGKKDAEWSYTCRGCGDNWGNFWEPSVRRHAQDHAAQCTAMPRPSA